MAEPTYQAAFRVAYDVLTEWLNALRPLDGEGADNHAVKDVERCVECLVKLREAARVHPGITPDSPRSQSTASLSGETFKEEGVRKEQVSKKRVTKKLVTSYSEGFLKFWGWWQGRGSKKEAFEQWPTISQEDRNAIKADLVDRDRFKRDAEWLRDNGQAIPHAVRYLKNRRWEDKWDQVSAGEARVAEILAEVERERAQDGRS